MSVGAFRRGDVATLLRREHTDRRLKPTCVDEAGDRGEHRRNHQRRRAGGSAGYTPPVTGRQHGPRTQPNRGGMLCLAGSCGRGSAGRASPCQGEGRGFESRRPLHTFAQVRGPGRPGPQLQRRARTLAPTTQSINPDCHTYRHVRVRSLASRAINCDLLSALMPWCCTTLTVWCELLRSRARHQVRCNAWGDCAPESLTHPAYGV